QGLPQLTLGPIQLTAPVCRRFLLDPTGGMFRLQPRLERQVSEPLGQLEYRGTQLVEPLDRAHVGLHPPGSRSSRAGTVPPAPPSSSGRGRAGERPRSIDSSAASGLRTRRRTCAAAGP